VRYRVQIQIHGTRRSHLCKTTKEAMSLKEEWTTRGLPPKNAPALPDEISATVATVDDGLRHRVLNLEQRGKSAAVAERIRVFLKKTWPAGAAMPLNGLTVSTLEEYRDRRQQAGCQPNTIVRELREWRAMLKGAIPEFKVPTNIFPPENLTRVRMLSPEEYTTVFPYLAAKYGEVFADLSQLALLGVMRQADVRFLKRSQVRLTERVLLLPTTKGDQPRAVRLSPDAITLLTRAMKREPRNDYIFANPRSGQPYSRVHVSRCWRNAARECGLQDFHFHDLRHHGPTVAVNAGASSAVLQAMGGWKSAKMVERYAHVMAPALDHYLSQIGNGKRP
jgi:integrase